MIDDLLDKIALRFKKQLINKKSVQARLNERDDYYARWAASSALRGTPLEPPARSDSWGSDINYKDIPDEVIWHLQKGTLTKIKTSRVSKATLEKIQHRFDNGYKDANGGRTYGSYYELKEINGYLPAARKYIQGVLTVICFIIALIGLGIWIGYKHVQADHQAQYWAKINSPETYTADGFTETFPCSQVTATTLDSDSNLSSKEYTCEYFGGSDHEQIDTYTVEADQFLSNEYSPASEMQCGNPNTYTGNENTQVYYNETRTIDGATFVLCGVGQNPIYARIQNGNTVYTLSADPSNEKTTYTKLNALIQGFQLN